MITVNLNLSSLIVILATVLVLKLKRTQNYTRQAKVGRKVRELKLSRLPGHHQNTHIRALSCSKSLMQSSGWSNEDTSVKYQ